MLRNKSQLPYTLLLLAVGTGTAGFLFWLSDVTPAFEMDITLTAILLILALVVAMVDYEKFKTKAKRALDFIKQALGDDAWTL